MKRVEILSQRRLVDAFFKLDEAELRHDPARLLRASGGGLCPQPEERRRPRAVDGVGAARVAGQIMARPIVCAQHVSVQAATPSSTARAKRSGRRDGSNKPQAGTQGRETEDQEFRTAPFVRHPRCSGKDQLEYAL